MIQPRRFGFAAPLAVLLAAFLVAVTPAATTSAAQPRTGGGQIAANPTSVAFGPVAVGSVSHAFLVTLTNDTGATSDILASNVKFGGTNPGDFSAAVPAAPTDGSCDLANGASCTVGITFSPLGPGYRSGTVTFTDTNGNFVTIQASGSGTAGYFIATSAGAVQSFGNAPTGLGDAAGLSLKKPIVGLASTGDNGGYYLVGSDGGIFTYGVPAVYHGSTGALVLNKPIVGMAIAAPATPDLPDVQGYWLVASDGGVFSYGDAQFHGSTGGIHLNDPIVGMAVTPDGGGYWLVASDGGVFSYGDAQFYGSTGAIHLNQPIVGMAATPDGGGYWLVAADGGIFSFGDAQFYGSTGGIHLNEPIVGMAATPDGEGYWLVAADGGVFAFGDAPFLGSAVAPGVTNVIGIASSSAPVQPSSSLPAVERGTQVVRG
jgi:hypothetical protein